MHHIKFASISIS